MKKINIIFLLMIGLLIAQDTSNIRDLYNKLQENVSQSPNDFQTQDLLNKMYPQEVLDSANSKNPENFYDFNVAKEFGSKTDDKDDIGAKGIGGYIEAEKKDIRNKLLEVTKQKLGGIAKSTGRVSCYITRSQGFFKYHCPINNQNYGFSSTNPTDSPLSAKTNCEANCYDPKTTACVAVKPLAKQIDDKEKKQKVFQAIILNKKILNETITKDFDKNIKVKYFEFNIKNNADIYLDFSYEDETGFRKDMAKNLLLKALDDKNLTNGEKKRFYINSKVSKVILNFHVGKLTKNKNGMFEYEKVDLDNFADDEKIDDDKNKLIIKLTDGILFTPQTKRFACKASDVSNKKHLFVKSDLTDFITEDGSRISLAKSVSSGDNEDGSFSQESTCSATCRTKQECTLVQPELNIEEFFGFSEDCSTSTKAGAECSKQKCIDARENGAPIVNETIYDAKGNAIQTIVNGAVPSGVSRPRILAKNDRSFYEEKIKEEAKDRAYNNMLKDHKYVTSLPIKNKRETTYAIKTKQNSQKTENKVVLKEKNIDLLLKPGSEFFEKQMYIYVLLTLETTDINYYYTNKKGVKQNYKSRFYYMVKDRNTLEDYFFSRKGINWFHSDDLGFFSKNGTAPAFKTYNVFKKIKEENAKKGENKFYIQERIFDDKESPLNAYGPVRVRGYLISNSQGADVSSNDTTLHVSRVPVEELLINPGKNFPKKNNVQYLAGDIPVQYYLTVLASDKPLSYKEIKEKMIDEEKKLKQKNIIYNFMEMPDYIVSELKDDSILPNENISIYLFGDDKTLSAYASFKSEEDYKEAGYSYFWWGDPKKEQGDESIISLKPSENEPFKYYPQLPKEDSFIPLFENLDIKSMENKNISFGYSTGKYSDSDCRVFKTKKGLQTICLPWWGIEREYAEKKEPIADNAFQKWIKKYELPLVSKIVDVCTKVDPYANAFYNNDKEQKVNCTSYYDKNKSESCKSNPYSKECFVDTCPAKVKNSCELFKTDNFDSELPAIFTKKDLNSLDPNKFDKKFGEGKVGLKSYTYKCPAHSDVEINKVCLKQEQVEMNPANCNISQASNEEDRLKLKSNWIYCSTNNPIMDSSGNLTGFKGICPNTKKEVICGIKQVKQVIKTCIAPIFKDEAYDDVSVSEEHANCDFYSIAITDENDDIYKNNPTCLRNNDAADSRKGKLNVKFINENVNRTFIVSKNYKDAQEDLYCQYDGFKSPLLSSKCKDVQSQGGTFMDFTTSINDSKEILFVEQVSSLNSSGRINLGIGDSFSGTLYYLRKVPLKMDSVPERWENFIIINEGIPIELIHKIRESYYRDDLNIFSQKLMGEIDLHPLVLMPEFFNTNYRTENWFYYKFKIVQPKRKNPNSIACHCVSNYCSGFWDDIGKIFGDFEFKCEYRYYAINALKLYQNATVGLNILFPTPSDYEITFFNKENLPIHTQEITRKGLTSVSAGVLQTLAFNYKIRTPEQKDLDKKIEDKQKEIEEEKERIAKLPPIKKVKLIHDIKRFDEEFRGKNPPGGDWNCRCTGSCDWGWLVKRTWACDRQEHHYFVDYDKDQAQIAQELEDIQKRNEARKQDYKDRLKQANDNTRTCKSNLENKYSLCEANKLKWFNDSFIETHRVNKYWGSSNSQQQTNPYPDRVIRTVVDYESKEYGKITTIWDQYRPSENFSISNIDCQKITATGKNLCESKFPVSEPIFESTNILTRTHQENKELYDRLNNQLSQKIDEKTIGALQIACELSHEPLACEAFKKVQNPILPQTKLGEVCVSKFDPSKVGDLNFNIAVSCEPYDSDLNRLETELKDLQESLRKNSRNCVGDPFSPVGGGTIFGINSVDGSACELDRGEEFITKNSIYSVRVIDKETGAVTIKKLEFPLIFPNRIYYSYLKAVEDRRYKCCTILK
ncbi:hypothetical protein BKH42_03685 [Helicobacter sp. 13S00482-2]|uniref:hypothetical protein n=1 Tax=Helicobacter sp. 13S00482-2 TaxID=1476200 RepID=UPI000BA4F6F5|nr:hypothetical protein [Helicobacter sp. 13S00482-2]PAF53843.1 hypothetical protein BKH42_03685 [Helicobacter sp. 13S00482-2]